MMSGVVHQTTAVNGVADGNCVSADHIGQEPLLAESPPLLPRHMATPPPQNVMSAPPFFNVIIPVADNFGAPVNLSVSPSVDPSGADLPVNGRLTASRCCCDVAMTTMFNSTTIRYTDAIRTT